MSTGGRLLEARAVKSRVIPEKDPLLTTGEVVLHLIKGNIGAGALSLPYAFAKVGIAAGPVFYLCVVVVCIYNMDLLLYCKRRVSPDGHGMSFGDVAKQILGSGGKTVVNVFLVGTQLSFCCVYFTVVATNLHAILPARVAVDFDERQIILLVFPVILALSWVRSLHHITPFSALANCAVLLGIGIVFFYSAQAYVPEAPATPPIAFTWTSFPEFYGTAVYSFEGIGLVLPLENGMHEKARFRCVLLWTMVFIMVLFLCLGELPVLAFGTIDNGSMTAVLHQYFPGWPVALANVLMAVACLFTFPIQFYPALEILEKLLLRRGFFTPTIQSYDGLMPLPVSQLQSRASAGSSSTARVPQVLDKALKNTTQYEVRRTMFRSMLCTTLMLVAVCVPNVGLLISLFGAVGSSMLAVTIPPILYVNLDGATLSWYSWTLHMLVAGAGIVGMVAGSFQAIVDIASTFE
ncbi:hypothetical protein H310_05821 [Aphanomyces invadans]|uniref:Amino acid transporter transmembrane domain-containing protein n=1 Tax=Aphanomyces invadans TaxID=157072 RepID=A0A024U771_9STRA|nr:hypothetical protein H310_05821 [Aphanomyces invadans]ETW02271.1 hypothetical protein H310_05821 [Aphanomyces invadans]|eukprot:XP_008868876.1 hypothetical protein H310_05821 [Aphanomyces invadans]